MSVQYLSPDGLHKNPAFSQAVVVTGAARTVYVGGQNGVDEDGEIVGKTDLAAQTERALNNMKVALAAGGANPTDIVKMTIYIVQGQDLAAGFAAFQKTWGMPANPPVISGLFVAALAHPDFLVEIDAIAVVAE